MPVSSLKIENLNIPSTVLLLGGAHGLLEEVNNQLNNYPHIKTIVTEIRELDFMHQNLSVIVYFVGFGKPSLSQTLSATELLHQSLNISLQTRSRFILIISNSNLPICRMATTLVTQFVKVNKILHEVIEVDHNLSNADMAEFIVAKFIYKHHKIISVSEPVTKFSRAKKTAVSRIRFPFKRLIYFIRKACVLICIFYFVFGIQLLLLIPLTNRVKSTFLNNQFTESLGYTRISNVTYNLLRFQTMYLPGTKFILESVGGPEENVIKAASSFSELLNRLSALNVNTLSDLNSGWSSAYDKSASTLKSDLKSLYQYSTHLQPLLLSVAVKSDQLENDFDKLATLVPDKNLYLGYNRPVTYLLLLQDSSYLQPTGGVIDTLLKITVDGGVIKNLQIYDARVLASQVTGNIDPPVDFKRLTGISNWPFLQANWDPDFPRTAKNVAWFFNKVFSANIDFVIGLNDSIFPELLTMTGPVNIAGFSQTVTMNNYQSLKLSDSTKNLGGKEVSYIGKVLIALKDRLQNSSVEKKKELLLATLSLLDKRQIMIAPITDSLPELSLTGWSGGVHLSNCRSQPVCQNMYLYLVDTDLSQANRDYMLNKKTDIQYSISENRVEARVSVTVNLPENAGRITDHPYPIYERIYLPISAHLTSARVNSNSVLSGLFPVGVFNNLAGWGFLMNPAAGSESSLEIEYYQPLITTGTGFHLSIDIPNQPGMGDYAENITILYPKQWRVSTITNPSVVTSGTLRYNTSSRNYQKIEIDFNKK